MNRQASLFDWTPTVRGPSLPPAAACEEIAADDPGYVEEPEERDPSPLLLSDEPPPPPPCDRTFSLFGHDLFGEPIKPKAAPLAARFTVPPLSVLSARDGDWQARKRAWVTLGIEGEVGRDGCGSKLTMSETIQELKPTADPAATRMARSA